MAEDFIAALTESRHGVPMGFYTDCDTAVCRECAPDGFMAGEYSEWPGFEGWESPAPIFMTDESDSVTHCAKCGRVIAHDLTAEGMASITESLERHLAGDTGAAIAQWMEAYGEDMGGGTYAFDLPEEYMAAFRQAYAVALISLGHVDGSDEAPEAAWWQSPGDPEWAVSAFAPECREEVQRDCERFVRECWEDLGAVGDAGRAGHDFALTRNGEGAGFWSRGLGAAGDRLTETAHRFDEVDVWVSADDVDNGSAVVHLN